MGFFSDLWSDIRDPLESAASLAGNYFLPGSSMITSHLVSKGAQKELGSTVGQLAQLASGATGAGFGQGVTGIPSASDLGYGWGNLANSVGIGNLFGGSPSATQSVLTGGGGGGGAAGGGYPSMTEAAISGVTGGSAPIAGDTGVLSAASGDYGPYVSEAAKRAAQAAQTAGAQAPAAAAGKGWLDTAMGAIKAQPMQALGLGMGALNILGQKPAQPDPRLMAMGTPMQDASQQLLKQYQSGALNPADQFRIAQWADQQKAAMRDYYARAGLGDSSMAIQAMGQIDAQANAMRDQARQSALTGAMQTAGIAQGPIQSAIQLQLQQDQKARDAQSQFFEMLGKMGTQTA